MKLQRKWERGRYAACIVLLCTVAVLLLPLPRWLLAADFVVMAGVCVGIAVISTRHLRCTSCGKTIAPMPLANFGKRFYCPLCGKPFVYDDEAWPGDET